MQIIAKFHFIILVHEKRIWNYLTSLHFSFPGQRIALIKMKIWPCNISECWKLVSPALKIVNVCLPAIQALQDLFDLIGWNWKVFIFSVVGTFLFGLTIFDLHYHSTTINSNQGWKKGLSWSSGSMNLVLQAPFFHLFYIY